MTLNTEIINSLPVLLQDETFLLKRTSIHIEVKGDGLETLGCIGQLFLTSQRLIFVSSTPKHFGKSNITLTSFSIKLSQYKKEVFNQPIFGCNYLSGLSANNDLHFKFYFSGGGAGVFLPSFRRALFNSRQQLERVRAHEAALDVIKEAKKLASSDPNDPSIIYLTTEN